MQVEVVFHRLAAKEVREAEAWYASRSPQVAERFRAEILAAAERIATNTAMHRLGQSRFRYVRVHRFPYRLIFCFETPERARVLAVAHDRRRPGYWRRRD